LQPELQGKALTPDSEVDRPSREYPWIVSRKPTLGDARYAEVVAPCDRLGFPTGDLVPFAPSPPPP